MTRVYKKSPALLAFLSDGRMAWLGNAVSKMALSQILRIYENLRGLGRNAPVNKGAHRDPECHYREI
jgi:hypothetical protein